MHKYHKVKQKDVSIRDTHRKAQRLRGHREAAFSCFDALVPSDLQNHCMLAKPHKTHKCTNSMRQTRQDGPGDKFPPGRPHIQARSALLCPQAFPGWPSE